MAYMKIRDFAEQYGISRQAVYQRIKKDLADYVKKADGDTLIDTAAAELFASSSKADKDLTVNQSINTDKLIDSLKDQIIAKDEQIRILQEQIMQLLNINQEQFTALNSQSDKLREQLECQNAHIMQQSERLSLLLSQQQFLTQTIAADPDEQSKPEDTVIIEEPEKPSIWRKLFKKNTAGI